ncbi:hypothetical protein N5C46_12695 [Rossellomorea vietnamensis]|uniref:Uncharacterized protein n=1 Tax=Rossellomorea vietnamensis TaxID=218284 RepID=A0ACD4C268_9BACI|nr:hypothetical protein [Rossellomorea vietnamensis]OXS64194.1 hypothetical protein B1B00_00250 [Bacillus sp. DSM 27956]PRX79313.1 hypothetical protein B0G93_10155 [Bacillus sp. V-88]UXH42607.1 hypothetical protein N5C46_12695 [Rossellomorea vietnamensis]SLJ91110.1 hypothetical protein SAMN06295884_10155 [Bacillus sp. V-88]
MENKYKHVIDEAVVKLYDRYPELDEKFGEAGRKKCYEDNIHHFNYLESAADVGESKVFSDYALWLNSVLVSRGMKSDHLIDNFKCIMESLEETRVEKGEAFELYLKQAIESIQAADREEPASS